MDGTHALICYTYHPHISMQWVIKENLWAANAGIPIVPIFDADRYRWPELAKWQRKCPWVFALQAVPITKQHRRTSTAMMFKTIHTAINSENVVPPVPYEYVETAASAHVKVSLMRLKYIRHPVPCRHR